MQSLRQGVQRVFSRVRPPKAAAKTPAPPPPPARSPQRRYEACVLGDNARRAQVSVLQPSAGAAASPAPGYQQLCLGALFNPLLTRPPQGGCAICTGTMLYLREKGLDVEITRFVDPSLDDAPAVSADHSPSHFLSQPVLFLGVPGPAGRC